jgi:hypothetical protein
MRSSKYAVWLSEVYPWSKTSVLSVFSSVAAAAWRSLEALEGS